MPEKEAKTGKKPAPKSGKPEFETVDAPFETIIDAILEADPGYIRRDMALRREKSKNK